ncbi:unnamed protein product, partial [Discosporangium mesarthrocarpum]
MTVPSDLDADVLEKAGDGGYTPAEVFVSLEHNETVGYLEVDLRPDYRYLYWTVPGDAEEGNGKVQRKRLSNYTGSTSYEDLTGTIQAGMSSLGYSLTNPQGIALDLRQRKIYFADAQVQGLAGGEDGIVVRCNLDGSTVEIAASTNLSDPRAPLDTALEVMYITDTHVPSVLRAELYNYTKSDPQQVNTIVTGVYQKRFGEQYIETYFQPLISPQAIQIDTRQPDQGILFFSDVETGFIYTVNTDGTEAKPFVEMGRPRSFIFDLGEGYPDFTLYYDCYGHGVCSGAPYFTCSCDEGYEGNCAQTTCPKARRCSLIGPAWFDEAKTDGSAHDYMECSNRGHCDRETATCVCHKGFTGNACQRMECPNDCSGHGKCLSMRQLALLATDPNLVPEPHIYGTYANSTNTWDADSVFGCSCDWLGYQGTGPSYTNLSDWTGYDCSRRTCPTGDDPRSAQFNATAFERQNVTCQTSWGGQQNETFSLSFRQASTSNINANATVEEFEEALEALTTIGDVTLSGSGAYSGGPVCSPLGDVSVSILFKTELGNLPLLADASPTTALAATLTVVEATQGTKLDAECSRHGLCDNAVGECHCFDGWASSDGDGRVGHRLDCGWPVGD